MNNGARGRRWSGCKRPSALGEFCRQLVQLLGSLLGRLGFALGGGLGPLEVGLLAKALLERLGGMSPMLICNIGHRSACEIETLRRLFHRLQIAQRPGVHAQRSTQGLAIKTGLGGLYLFVDTDGQRQAVAKDGEAIL